MRNFKESLSAAAILVAVAFIFFFSGLKFGKEIQLERMHAGFSCSTLPDGSGDMVCKMHSTNS